MNRLSPTRGAPRAPGAAMALVVVLAMLTACAPPVPSGATTGFAQVCAFDRIPIERVDITIVETVPDGTLGYSVKSSLGPNSDEYLIEGGSFDNLDVGSTYAAVPWGSFPTVADPGLCVHVSGSDGVVFQTTAVRTNDPALLLKWAIYDATGTWLGGVVQGFDPQ